MINQIICGDCLEVMKDFEDNSVDLVLTDPPYGINIAKTGKWGGDNLAKAKDYGASCWDCEPMSPEEQADPCHHNFDGRHFIRCLKVVMNTLSS
jgi:DNA modification methylase